MGLIGGFEFSQMAPFPSISDTSEESKEAELFCRTVKAEGIATP